MPGSSDGIDLNKNARQELNFDDYSRDIKRYGVALHSNDSVIITKIKVKAKSIEFQLGGGGFGTLGDDTNTTVTIQPVPKSQREKNLENDLDNTTDPGEKRRIRNQLDDLRDRRAREDARNQNLAAEASERKREAVAQKRLEGGSRFNLKYDRALTAIYLRPEAIMDALAKYLIFPEESFRGGDEYNRRYNDPGPPPPRDDRGPTPTSVIRKGMSQQDLEAMYGRPINTRERTEGTFRVTVCTFSQGRDQVLEAEFVEGVLVRYRISSR
jgi:hypothetical protein